MWLTTAIALGSACLLGSASAAACDATQWDGDWSGSWWRTKESPPAQGVYTFKSQNATHFSVSSKSPHTGWENGGAFGVLDADFATSGRLTITFPTNHPRDRTIRATVEDRSACSTIWLDNKSVWCKGAKPGTKSCGTGKRPPVPPAPPGPPPPHAMSEIKKVYIVFSNHLDVGYTDNNNGSCAGAVINRYWHDHFPKAIATAAEFKAKQPTWRYKWMCHSWIVSMFRHCQNSTVNIAAGPNEPSDLQCPTTSALAAFESAARAGIINWHAFPFNAEPEAYDAGMFEASLQLTFDEDEYFGLPKRMTYSQRDVPGLTRAAIPLLAKAGVKGVTVGENGACAPVNVPPIFLWRDNATDTEVIALFHPHGYGRRRQLHNFGESDTESRGVGAGDCVENEDSKTAICYAWRSDNQGPHAYSEALGIFTSVQKMFPNATVSASDAFDDFIAAVEPFKANLPVVTAEIGDTWIHGASTDPLKVALFRSASRQRAKCIDAGSCDPPPKSAAFKDFERLLTKVGEHTWGWNNGDLRSTAWSNPEFEAAKKLDKQYSTAAKTWQEQRSFVPNAVAALGGGSLQAAIEAEWAELRPERFDEIGFETVAISQRFVCGTTTIGFSSMGGVEHLKGPGGTDWATEEHQLVLPWYRNDDVDYYHQFDHDYNGHDAGNFMKKGLNLTAMNSNATLEKLQRKAGQTNTTFKLTMTMDPKVHVERGAPATLEALVVVPHSSQNGTVDVEYTLQWFDKTPCHAPETIWLRNTPAVKDATAWRIDKLGSMVNPLDADLTNNNGGPWSNDAICNPSGTTCGVHLHAIDSGAFYSGVEGKLGLKSLDSMLISIGDPLPAPTPLTVPNPLGGVHFSLVDNTWNTNVSGQIPGRTITITLCILLVTIIAHQYPEWYPFIEATTATPFPGGQGDENSRFRFVISIS